MEAFVSPDEAVAYYNPKSASSILTAIDDLSSWIGYNGPFDGVMGFSQGASLAAMVLARARLSNPPLFSFAVFICAGLPYCEDALRVGEVKFLKAADLEDPLILVPTVHIVGSKDPDVEYGRELAKLCQEWGRLTIDHGAGHEIPRAPVEVTQQMANAVVQVMRKSTFGQ
jgi:predicted esterase